MCLQVAEQKTRGREKRALHPSNTNASKTEGLYNSISSKELENTNIILKPQAGRSEGSFQNAMLISIRLTPYFDGVSYKLERAGKHKETLETEAGKSEGSFQNGIVISMIFTSCLS